MAATEQDESGGGIAGRVVDFLLDRVLPFPWAGGFLAGCGAFVAGYLVLVGYMLVGIAPLRGSVTDRLLGIGFIFYNSHTVSIISSKVNVINPTPDPVAGAALPEAYYIVPILVLVVASGVFTYWYDPTEQDGFLAVATGLSMTIGYLLLALSGTFLVTQGPLHPARVQTLVYGVAYPLLLGIFGSIVAQSFLLARGNAESDREADE